MRPDLATRLAGRLEVRLNLQDGTRGLVFEEPVAHQPLPCAAASAGKGEEQ